MTAEKIPVVWTPVLSLGDTYILWDVGQLD